MKDYCATCGEALIETPFGGRYACHASDAQYWSAHEPLQDDLRGLYQMTGEKVAVQTACATPAGDIVRHAPLYLYRAV